MAAGKGTGLNQQTLWRDATRLLRLIEDAVRRFPRYPKYTRPTVSRITNPEPPHAKPQTPTRPPRSGQISFDYTGVT